MAAGPEAKQKIMDEWGAWYGMLGESIVELGPDRLPTRQSDESNEPGCRGAGSHLPGLSKRASDDAAATSFEAAGKPRL